MAFALGRRGGLDADLRRLRWPNIHATAAAVPRIAIDLGQPMSPHGRNRSTTTTAAACIAPPAARVATMRMFTHRILAGLAPLCKSLQVLLHS